jgi:hypothetical protein
VAKVKLPIYLRLGGGKERRVGTLKLAATVTEGELVLELGEALEEVAAYVRGEPGAEARWAKDLRFSARSRG